MATPETLTVLRLTPIWLAASPLAPTWKFIVPAEPSSSFLPLKLVDVPMRPSSLCRLLTSVAMAARASPLFESLPACTARSRMRCRIAWVSVSAPSAVWTTEMPSWALREACLRPPTCERRPSEMARPAASSAARLMRNPLESFSSDFDIWPCVTERLR